MAGPGRPRVAKPRIIISVSLPQDIAERLEEERWARRLSRSEIVNLVLRGHFAKRKAKAKAGGSR